MIMTRCNDFRDGLEATAQLSDPEYKSSIFPVYLLKFLYERMETKI